VSLIAIGVLLMVTNWFFHKTYWKTGWPVSPAEAPPDQP
jgi:hypothetical protein